MTDRQTRKVKIRVAKAERSRTNRLCSDRRYSDNLQAVRPSTSLARLAHVEIVEIGNKLEWVEALDASKARHWSRHWGDWGERSLGRVSQWVWGVPSSGKVTTYVHNCTAPDFRDLVRRLSNQYCPWAYSTAVSHTTSRLCTDCRNSVCRNRVCRNSVVYPWPLCKCNTINRKNQLTQTNFAVKFVWRRRFHRKTAFWKLLVMPPMAVWGVVYEHGGTGSLLICALWWWSCDITFKFIKVF